jgi:hypothetical protein
VTRRRDRGHVAGLDAEVELLAERVGKAGRQVADADGTPPSGAALHGAGEPPAELAAPRHRPRQRPGWHQRLGDHQEHHGNDQGGRRGQHEEPHRGDGALSGRDRPEDRPGDGPHHREREQAGGQQPHHPEPHAQQPSGEESEPADDRDDAQHDEDGGQGDGEDSHARTTIRTPPPTEGISESR